MESFAKSVGKSSIVAIVLFLCTIPPACMWYTFDDKLAEITGVASLGEIPFWNMYGFTFFIAFLGLGRTAASNVRARSESKG